MNEHPLVVRIALFVRICGIDDSLHDFEYNVFDVVLE